MAASKGELSQVKASEGAHFFSVCRFAYRGIDEALQLDSKAAQRGVFAIKRQCSHQNIQKAL